MNDGVALIPLTFGNQSDWARNVTAAGECWTHQRGIAYHAVRPTFLDTRDAAPLVRAAFGPPSDWHSNFLGSNSLCRCMYRSSNRISPTLETKGISP